MAAIARSGKDALVTISCDPSLPLEERIELLTYAFTRAVKGAALRKVIAWDIAEGTVAFILTGRWGTSPRGVISARLEDVENVSAEFSAV